MPEAIRESSLKRLDQAEQRGLRLAIACRTAVIGAALLWYVGASVFSDQAPRLWGTFALMLFTLIGIAHLLVIGTRFDRWWLKYAIYTVDILGICAFFVIRACSHHVNSQPTALKKFRHSCGLNIWQTSPIAFQTSSKVLAPALLR